MKRVLKKYGLGISFIIIGFLFLLNNLIFKNANYKIVLYLIFFCNLFFMSKKGLYRGFFFFIFTSFTLIPILTCLILLAAIDVFSFENLEAFIAPIIMFDFALLSIFASSNLGIRIVSYQSKARNNIVNQIKDMIKRK